MGPTAGAMVSKAMVSRATVSWLVDDMLVDGTDRRHDNLVKVSKREEGKANHTHSHIPDCRTSQMHILTRTHTHMHIGSRPGGRTLTPNTTPLHTPMHIGTRPGGRTSTRVGSRSSLPLTRTDHSRRSGRAPVRRALVGSVRERAIVSRVKALVYLLGAASLGGGGARSRPCAQLQAHLHRGDPYICISYAYICKHICVRL